jgi:GAF domain-containing protein
MRARIGPGEEVVRRHERQLCGNKYGCLMDRSHLRGEAFVELVSSRVNDPQRLAAVAATGLLDTAPATGFDRIASLAARLLDTPFGFVTVVDETRSFWKACIGVDATDPAERQNRVEESFCQYVIGLDDALLVDDTRLDERTAANPSITSMGVLAWAGVPLRSPGGDVLGTVCVVDTRTRSWTDADAALLHDLAAIAADEITANQTAVAASRSEALLASILQRAPIGFALVDHDLRYEIVNDVLADINGATIESHIGRTINDVVPDVADGVNALLGSVISTGEPVTGVEVVGTTPSQPNVQRTWSTNYYRLDLDGDLRVGLFVEEITERANARRRAQRLATITEDLAGADSTDEVANVIGDHLAEYFGAYAAAVGVVNRPGPSISILAGSNVLAALGQITVTVEDDTAYGVALRSGEAVFVTDAQDRATRFGSGFQLPIGASAALPCQSADGSTIAVMVIGWARRIEQGQFPVDQLKTMAALIGNVLERNRAADERRDLIDSLQTTLLAAPAPINGLEIAVRYEPAVGALGFGGDWYEVVVLGPHRSALVVGDVVGHDATAAAHMTQIRTILSDLMLLNTPLEDLFDRTNQLLAARQSATMATIGVVVVDTNERTLTALSAGHLPALVVRPCGDVEILTPALRPPVLVAGGRLAISPVHYEPGSIVVMFTDGLLETRGGVIDDDLDTLRRYIHAMDGVAPHDLADKLLADFAARTDRSDDIAIVCARLD